MSTKNEVEMGSTTYQFVHGLHTMWRSLAEDFSWRAQHLSTSRVDRTSMPGDKQMEVSGVTYITKGLAR